MTDEQRIKKAEQASTLAFVSVIMCLMVCCGGSCFTLIVALPLGLWSLSLARAALDGEDVPDLVIAYAVPARNLSMVSTIWSGAILCLMAAYILLYLGMFAVLIGSAVMIPPPSAPMPIPVPFVP